MFPTVVSSLAMLEPDVSIKNWEAFVEKYAAVVQINEKWINAQPN